MLHTDLSILQIVSGYRFAQEMVIFLGAWSGVVFGQVTVRTPFSREALTSSP